MSTLKSWHAQSGFGKVQQCSSLTAVSSVRVREGAPGPGRRWPQDLGDPCQEHAGDSMCREAQRAAGHRLQAERCHGDRRSVRNQRWEAAAEVVAGNEAGFTPHGARFLILIFN